MSSLRLRLLQDGSVTTLSDLIKSDPEQIFNAFLAGIAITKKNSQLKAMVVNYRMPEQEKVEQRLPGGCLKTDDVVLALQQMNGEYSDLRKRVEVESGFLSMDSKFSGGLDHSYVAQVWAKFTKIILKEMEPMSRSFEELVRASYDNALTREFSEEVSGEYKQAYICAIQTSGQHKKIGCLLTDYKGPEEIESGSEDDIESARMMNVGTINNGIAPRHRNFFRAGCGLYAQMHPTHSEELSALTK